MLFTNLTIGGHKLHNKAFNHAGPLALLGPSKASLFWARLIHRYASKMKNPLIIILLLLVTELALACEAPEHDFSRIQNSEKHIVKGPFTIEHLEKTNMIEIRETKEKLPFGYSNKEWKELKSLYKTGDKFYFVRYESGGRYFDEQHILVRGSCIIGSLLGAMG